MKKYFALTFLVISLWGCKPTERNYQAAFDKAYEASLRKAESETTGTDGRVLESIDGPRNETVDSLLIAVGPSLVKPLDEGFDSVKGKVGLAVSQYRMPTNARRNVEDLKDKYHDAFVATDGKESYYVVVECVNSLQEIGEPIRRFVSNFPNFHYMGLDGKPMAVHISAR